MDHQLLSSNIRVIGKENQDKLTYSKIAIAGLGGVGGIAFLLLVRAGVNNLHIADFGFFEKSNANRQILWSKNNDGRKKIDVAKKQAKLLNARAEVKTFFKIDKKTIDSFLDGCDLVIDTTDNFKTRKLIYQSCSKKEIPYIFASAFGSKGLVSVILSPSADIFRFKKVFPKTCDYCLGPVANLIGSIAAQQAINLILKKSFITYPKILLYDAFSKEQFYLF
jgi:adenylyltransferase/sulfurtransferase